MSTIDQNSQNSLSAILDKLGINRADEKKKLLNTLGQEDFLKLMTTQLQNKTRLRPWKTAILLLRWPSFRPSRA